MSTQYDEKGKIFTQVVAKHPIHVMIQTDQYAIHGIIHIRPGMRIKDELNGSEQFLAVTDATIMDRENNELFRTGFMVVNINHVVIIVPKEDVPH